MGFVFLFQGGVLLSGAGQAGARGHGSVHYESGKAENGTNTTVGFDDNAKQTFVLAGCIIGHFPQVVFYAGARDQIEVLGDWRRKAP